MSDQDYNPNSVDAVLSRIENKLTQHVDGTASYRKSLDDNLKAHGDRIADLEACKTKAVGFMAGAGLSGGALGSWLHKLFG